MSLKNLKRRLKRLEDQRDDIIRVTQYIVDLTTYKKEGFHVDNHLPNALEILNEMLGVEKLKLI